MLISEIKFLLGKLTRYILLHHILDFFLRKSKAEEIVELSDRRLSGHILATNRARALKLRRGFISAKSNRAARTL